MLKKKQTRKTTKRGGSDPVLLALRGADCVRHRAQRMGPSRARSALASCNCIDEPTDRELVLAFAHIEAVERIADVNARRAVEIAMKTHGCRCSLTIAEIAKELGVPRVTAHRWLHRGLSMISFQSEKQAA